MLRTEYVGREGARVERKRLRREEGVSAKGKSLLMRRSGLAPPCFLAL
jgi:hypothetical protein